MRAPFATLSIGLFQVLDRGSISGYLETLNCATDEFRRVASIVLVWDNFESLDSVSEVSIPVADLLS